MNAETNSANESSLTPPPPNAATEFAGDGGHIPLPAGWKSLATHWRDTRLYVVSSPGGGLHWEAAAVFHGEVVHRRFASELHALAWLSATNEPHFSQNPFDLEELKQPYRLAGILRGGKAMPQP